MNNMNNIPMNPMNVSGMNNMNSMMNANNAGTAYYPDPTNEIPIAAANNGEIVTPPEESFDSEAMRGSMQQILSDNLGQFVVCEFLIGTATMTRKEGILYSVGRSYVVLYEEINRNFVVCDIFSIKFVTFYLPGQRPPRSNNAQRPNTAAANNVR